MKDSYGSVLILILYDRLDQAFHLTFKQCESPPAVLLKGDSGTGNCYLELNSDEVSLISA